jgi:hypothetical protein
MFEKMPHPRHSNRLSDVFIPGESITNTSNSTNIGKNSNCFWACLLGQEKFFDKKTGDEKSRATVPLSLVLSFSLFISFLLLIYLNFHLKVYRIPYTGNYTE